jgi:hypothetical protein
VAAVGACQLPKKAQQLLLLWGVAPRKRALINMPRCRL